MLQVNGCASGLTIACSLILRMAHNYFTSGTYQFLMIAEATLASPRSRLITLRCVLKKSSVWKYFEVALNVFIGTDGGL